VLRIMGIILIVVALVIAITPQFTDCYSRGLQIDLGGGKTVPMKCHWTAIGEIATGVPLMAVGIMMLVAKRRETFYVLSVMGLIINALIIFIPTQMIGVCAMPTHTCVTEMKPVLLISGVAGLIASAVIILYSTRVKE
jgi:hypothetical protein